MSSVAHRAAWSSGSVPSVVSVVIGGVLSPSLSRLFAEQNGRVKLVGVCRRSAEILRAIESSNPDVLLLAAPITQSRLVTLLRQIRARSHINILLLTNCRDPHFIGTVVRYGVKGCVRTRSIGTEIPKAIVAVKQGEVWLERRILAEALGALVAELDPVHGSDAQIPQPVLRNRLLLTNRESEIVELLGQGLTNKEIAKELDLSTETVKRHLRNIFAKLGVHRRTQVLCSRLTHR